MIKIGFISDTHNTHANKWGLKPCDLIIHSGDFSFRGEESEIKQFIKDATKAKRDCGAEEFIIVPGNHELGVEANEELFKTLCKENDIICLINEGYDFGGVRIWGTPWQPEFCNWAYNVWDDWELAEKYQDIPIGTHVLVTHCPPKDILDYSPLCGNVGSKPLLDRVQQVEPYIHAFGHIHHSYGTKVEGNTLFVNSALLDDRYKQKNGMIVVDFDEEKRYIKNIDEKKDDN